MSISEAKVLESQAGFYIGRTVLSDTFMPGRTVELPYSRESNYYYSKWEPGIVLGTVDFDEAIKEIEQEIPRAKALKSKLAKDRLRFLEACLASFKSGTIPLKRWDYNRMS